MSAGMSPINALRSATKHPAARFALRDRGTIAVGKRGDLVLVDGDPTRDITATRAIVGVWKAGQKFDRERYLDEIMTRRRPASDRPIEAGQTRPE